MANKWDERKKAKEDEYFVKKERELLANMKAKQESEAREAAKTASYMKCPKCGADLTERNFEDVKVDACPDCHGIWIDQGEIGLLRQIHESRGPFSRIMNDILEIFHHPKTGDATTAPR